MKKQRLLIALLSIAFCFSFMFGISKVNTAKAAPSPVAVAEMLENADDLRPAFNYGGGERLAINEGAISCWQDGHFFYCQEVDAVAFDITFSAGNDVCFALRTDGGGQMWTSHGYYAFVYQKGAAGYAELYKVTDCSAWQTAETQLAKGDVANVFDGSAHSVVFSFDESTGALSLTIDDVSIVGTDAGEPIAKENSNFKIARVNSGALYTVSATGAETPDPEPDPDPTPDPEPEPEPEDTGVAITNEVMLENTDKLLPAFNYGGAERCVVKNGQISSWEDGNFYYRDEVDSASFTFTAGKAQSMLFVGLHLSSSNVPWASTGYYAFIQDGNASVYKIDASDMGAWTGAILGEAVALPVNVFDGEAHEIAFAVSGKTLTFVVDETTIERTFEDDALPVANTEFGMSSNGTGAFLLGEAELVIEVKDYEGEFTNIETLIAQGAIRADYNYNGDFHCVKSNGFVEANEYKMSINATLTAIDFDIVVTAGNSMYFAMRTTRGGAIWEIGGYAVWLDGTTLKLFDLSTNWHDAPDVIVNNFTNIYDGEAHNIKMYVFDDENGFAQIGFSVDGGEWVRYVDTTSVITLDGHTEMFLMNVNDASLRYKVTAPEGTNHNYGEPSVTPPTCTEDGYTSTVCADCGKTIVTAGETATGHDYKAVVTEPTCLVDGYTTYTCACGDSYVEAGEAATGHAHVPTVVAPTCEDKGYTQYTCACGDSYMDNFVDELGHDMADATCTAPETCKREGCDYTEGEALGHDHGDWVVEKEATTSEEGLQSKTCSRCGDKISEPIPVKKASKGCTGSVGGSLVGILGLCLSAIIIKRKHN